MLREILKEETKVAHQKTEATVIRKLKKVNTENDYIELLKCFYSYFSAVEKEISPFLTEEILPDLSKRRDASYIIQDIEELGGNLEDLPPAQTPEITSVIEALSAMYVLEGSLMGGPYIIKMLEKRGIERGFSFFEGYGVDSGKMIKTFMDTLNREGEKIEDKTNAIQAAENTFRNFGEIFQTLSETV